MAKGFTSISYHVSEGSLPDSFESISDQSLIPPKDLSIGDESEKFEFSNDEAAARFYLGQVLALSKLESIKSLSSSSIPGLVPDMRVQTVRESPLTNTRTVVFQQTQSSIPVFGSQVNVEIDLDRNLVALDAELAELSRISPMADISPSDALVQIANFTKEPIQIFNDVQPPALTFFFNEESGSWHLAYFFQNIPAAPKQFLDDVAGEGYRGHGMSNFLRLSMLAMNYLVDAHDGEVIFFYSANPMLEIPSKCKGLDENGLKLEFYGRQLPDGFEMYDPLRNLKTYDLKFQDLLNTPPPKEGVKNQKSDWEDTNQAAVSAHINAMRVYDFYKGELKRDGVDDHGMELISIVNVTMPANQSPPEWFNAVWWNKCMWYGQKLGDDGKLYSYSRYLDIIAHELTHGVTQFTCNLVYKDQSGALNESFSDIFGVIIKNWYLYGPDSDVSLWNWEIGEGLGKSGTNPLRDLSDPGRTGDPAHMKDYIDTTWDNGGVHINSNIHNKAAYNVLTAVDEEGERIFPPREVAILYYLTLTRLNMLADFSKVRRMLIDVARTFYAGDELEQQKKIEAIQRCYSAVGIY